MGSLACEEIEMRLAKKVANVAKEVLILLIFPPGSSGGADCIDGVLPGRRVLLILQAGRRLRAEGRVPLRIWPAEVGKVF